MEYVVAWVIGAAVVGLIATSRGHGFLAFFALSLVLSPLLGLILALVGPRGGEQRAPCWRCKEAVIVGAEVCRYCGAELDWPKPNQA